MTAQHLSLDTGEIGDCAGRLANFIEQVESILPELIVLDIDRHPVEERIDVRTELGHWTHRGFEVLSADSGVRLPFDGIDRVGQCRFFLLPIERWLRL